MDRTELWGYLKETLRRTRDAESDPATPILEWLAVDAAHSQACALGVRRGLLSEAEAAAWQATADDDLALPPERR